TRPAPSLGAAALLRQSSWALRFVRPGALVEQVGQQVVELGLRNLLGDVGGHRRNLQVAGGALVVEEGQAARPGRGALAGAVLTEPSMSDVEDEIEQHEGGVTAPVADEHMGDSRTRDKASWIRSVPPNSTLGIKKIRRQGFRLTDRSQGVEWVDRATA